MDPLHFLLCLVTYIVAIFVVSFFVGCLSQLRTLFPKTITVLSGLVMLGVIVFAVMQA